MSNNGPPAAVLELSQEDASVLLAMMDGNIETSLKILAMVQAGTLGRATAEKVIRITEVSRRTRQALKNQGVEPAALD